MRRFLFLSLVILLSSSVLFAQFDSASVLGTVRDSTVALVSGANQRPKHHDRCWAVRISLRAKQGTKIEFFRNLFYSCRRPPYSNSAFHPPRAKQSFRSARPL